MIQSLQDLFNKELRTQRQLMTDALANGDVQTFEEYNHTVGKIQGITMAEVYFNDLIAKMRNDEEDKRDE